MKTTDIRLWDLPQRKGVKIRYADIVVAFDHLDGMYSYCTVVGGKSHGQVFHLSGGAPLKKIVADDAEYEVLL